MSSETEVEARQAVHAHEPRHCTTADLFAVNGEAEELTSFLAESDKYLSAFAAPVKDGDGKPVCFHCGKQLSAFAQMFGTGVAYQWGLTHGEATCSGCGWPARGMHYPKGEDGEELFSLRNLFLAYHPDQVEQRSGGEA